MLELTIPTIQPGQRPAGEFRPRTLESWLARLPTTDSDASLRQLRKALSAQNRVALDPALRLQLMEMYLAPFQALYALRQSDLRAVLRVPLDPRFRSRQEEMLDLLDALATGYKIAVLDLVSGQGRGERLALALQRAMHCLGEMLVVAFELYIRPPGTTWREVHELYRCAEEEDLRTLEVAPLPGHDDPADILGTYAPILLLGASSPYSLLPGEARRLYGLAPRWRRSCRISTPSALPGEPGHFRFALDVDAPPVPVSKSSRPVDGATRVLKTLGVARAMHQILTDINNAATQKALQKVLGPGAQPADAELFRRAGRVFGEVDIKRSSNRFPARYDVELYAGFDAVYFACNDRRAFDASAAAAPAPATSAVAAEQFIDLSEPMLGEPIDAPREAEPADAPMGGHESFLARSANQSAGGMCLVLPRTGQERLKVGDIAACRFTGAPDWQLGVLRWMRVGSREVRFGLQFLGPAALPVAVLHEPVGRGNGGGAPRALAAIWLPENPALKQPSSLILPRSAEPYPSSLEFRGDGGGPVRARLLRRVERTGDYEQFLVSLDPADPDSQSALSS